MGRRAGCSTGGDGTSHCSDPSMPTTAQNEHRMGSALVVPVITLST